MKKVLFMSKSPRFVKNVQIENYLGIDPVTKFVRRSVAKALLISFAA